MTAELTRESIEGSLLYNTAFVVALVLTWIAWKYRRKP